MNTEEPKVHERVTADLPINAIVAEVLVDCPSQDGTKLKVLRSLRDDPLARLHARDQLRTPEERREDRSTGRHSGDARFIAGRKWQSFYERTMIGGVRAIDPTKEAVDGGRMPELLTEGRRMAALKLAQAKQALGDDGNSLLHDVLGEGLSMAQVAARRGMPKWYATGYLGARFRECLERLVKTWGLTT